MSQSTMRYRKKDMRFGAKYTDDDIIAALQQCGRDLGDPSFGVKRYAEWRKEQEETYASHPLILRRVVTATGMRGWNAWKAAAGQKINENKAKGFGTPTFTDEDIYLAFQRLEEILDYFPTVLEYDKVRLKSDPCAAAIRFRMGKWSQAYERYNEWKDPQERLFDFPQESKLVVR